MNQQLRTIEQQAVVEDLANRLNIDPERILFLNDKKPLEPWLSPEALLTIARQSNRFKHLDEGYQDFIPPLNQVVHHATFIDAAGNTFGRSGVATMGVSYGAGDIDAHTIAAGRAISACLNSAGINPLRPGSAIELGEFRPGALHERNAGATSRRANLARVHILAKEKKMIKENPTGPDDDREYRRFLLQYFNTNTAAGFDEVAFASLIEALHRYQPPVLEPEVDEFAELSEASAERPVN